MCTRAFEVPTYFEDVKNELGRISQSQTIIEKLAGASPELFKYSIEFFDESSVTGWIKQNTVPVENYRGICPFAQNFFQTKNYGTFQEKFSLSEIPGKLQELATDLNDCKQVPSPLPPGVDRVERQEKYAILIKPTPWSHISLIFLGLFLTALVLGVVKALCKFVKKDLSD